MVNFLVESKRRLRAFQGDDNYDPYPPGEFEGFQDFTTKNSRGETLLHLVFRSMICDMFVEPFGPHELVEMSTMSNMLELDSEGDSCLSLAIEYQEDFPLSKEQWGMWIEPNLQKIANGRGETVIDLLHRYGSPLG